MLTFPLGLIDPNPQLLIRVTLLGAGLILCCALLVKRVKVKINESVENRRVLIFVVKFMLVCFINCQFSNQKEKTPMELIQLLIQNGFVRLLVGIGALRLELQSG
jgi:hypothetical protein